MSVDSHFASPVFYAPTLSRATFPAHPKHDDSPGAGPFLDEADYAKQSFDFFHFGSTATSGVLAPHPDQFESELDSSLAAFDAELSLLPVETETQDIFSFLRSDTPTCGPPSTFTVSSESVSGYDSSYADSVSGRDSYYAFHPAYARSPASSYTASNYSFRTHELEMDFKRMALPAPQDEHKVFAALPASPSMRNSPATIPTIARYSPTTAGYSPRGSFSDYEPAQPHHVRIGSSAASDYYPQASIPGVNKQYNYGVGAVVSPSTVSPSLPAVPPIPVIATTPMPKKMEEMQQDPKKKYQCPSCPRAFARAYNLKTHIQTHDPNRSKPYSCHHKSCGRSFSRKHDLTRHLVSIHRAESVSSGSSTSKSIGVNKDTRGWCDNCGKGWVGKGKEKGCECDSAK
ncbi:uncharacterized protein LAESUDRAFT_759508 [Laetiporus sulphureus 93-53]|uniref:C2H2-type domain-containing protein n=1 Tax=Laetiporus sulphureus 93-53 TaxID=1314785 RepID=A0A165E6G4_9APHY|nr:uncharacterized protein LAESUDRAFT_759508 [Laetiporus sulphureus 93-53]KZT06328.1 hypothetical protein LAESUDRAFT_759508 [Laetiporus sulphureus 93-53]